MPHPDEGLIHAWLDGELSPDEAARVERLVREDAEWAAAAAEARGLIAASSRILGALDVVPGDVIPAGSRATPAAGKPRLQFAVRPWMRAAAGIVLVLGTYAVVRGTGEQAPVGFTAPPVARETLARGIADSAASSAAAARSPAGAAATSAPPPVPVERRTAVTLAAPARAAATMAAADTPVREPAPPPAPAPSAQESRREGEAARSALADASRGAAELEASMQRVRTTGLALRASPAAKAVTLDTLAGCWATRSADGRDTVLVAPRIIRQRGDTLTVIVDPARAPVTFVARRAECPARPDGR